MVTHLKATERYLPYGITHHTVLPATTQVNASCLKPSQAGWYLIYLPRGMEG